MRYLLLCLLACCQSVFAETPQGVIDVIAKRHSGYSFDSKSLSAKEIASLVEAARWAPSAFNAQPWNFIFCSKDDHPEAHANALACMPESNIAWAEKAPLLIVIVANKMYRNKNEEDRWGEYDTGAAVAQMALQAVSMGLMTHQMGEECDEKRIEELFAIPPGHRVMAVMAVGYPLIPDPDPEKERERLPIEENFFQRQWGSS